MGMDDVGHFTIYIIQEVERGPFLMPTDIALSFSSSIIHYFLNLIPQGGDITESKRQT